MVVIFVYKIIEMKKLSIIILLIVFTLMTSCAVFLHTDNGKHKGWYKKPGNTQKNHSIKPGKAKGKSKSIKFEPTAILKPEFNHGIFPYDSDNNYIFNLTVNPDLQIEE